MSKLAAIIRHEFRMAAANKAYVVLTVLGPFLILAVTVLPSLLNRDAGVIAAGMPVAVTSAAQGAGEAVQAVLESVGVETLAATDIEAAKAAVLDRELAGLVVVERGWPDVGRAAFYSRTGVDAALYSTVQAALGAFARETRLAASGVDPAVLMAVMAEPRFEVLKLDRSGAETTKDQDDFMEVLFVSLSFVMLLYMTVLLYGQMIGRSVVTEKTSKTVEVMLSSVTSRELMFGKILGLGLAGLLQYAVWIGMGLVLVEVLGPALGVAVPATVNPASFGWLLCFFVLAFFLYSSAYAALGAASEDEHHLGQLAWPLLMFLMVPLVMISTFIMQPDSTVSVILSIFPLTSPLVMLVRVLVSQPPAGQLAACIVLLVASVGGMALLASKIFRTGILMTGKRAKFGEMLRWITVR